MRDAPSLPSWPALVERRGEGAASSDPQGRREGEALLPGTQLAHDPVQGAQNADLIVRS